nr:hypothetical protein [Kibdelosporangium sp. MJ126-NF4]CEL15706.1 hypothetical protein [Kibdelosporangium sp. MJ126-NF4]CTQ93631.1 hypothetical protein [Kibdelosporangium sp. MJ126-NF4]
MRDWEQFLQYSPWFADPADVTVTDETAWSRGGVEGLPWLSALLNSARLTTLSISGTPYELLAWGPAESRRGWLCEPVAQPKPEVHQTHRLFWTVCGGIVEQFAGPRSWLLNQDDVLTATAAEQEIVANSLRDYGWLWKDEGLDVPIDPADYYAVAIEANGNVTMVHRRSGELLLFAPDHSFDKITPYPGCPKNSLYTFDELPDLASWIEACAEAWSD